MQIMSSDAAYRATRITNYACSLYIYTAGSTYTKAKLSLHDSITYVDCLEKGQSRLVKNLGLKKSNKLPGICEVINSLRITSSTKTVKLHKRKTSRLTRKASSSRNFTPHVLHMPDKDFDLEWSLCQQKERHPEDGNPKLLFEEMIGLLYGGTALF